MSKVPDRNLSLLIHICEERTAVVDAEVKDAVLVGSTERYAKNGRIRGLGDRREIEAVEGREHAEFELEGIVLSGDEGREMIVFVLGDFDLESLN